MKLNSSVMTGFIALTAASRGLDPACTLTLRGAMTIEDIEAALDEMVNDPLMPIKGWEAPLEDIQLTMNPLVPNDVPLIKNTVAMQDFEVILEALGRQGVIDYDSEKKLSPDQRHYRLLTEHMGYIAHECEKLDLSNMKLKELPIIAIFTMEKLKVLNISGNKKLKIFAIDIQVLKQQVSSLIMQDMGKAIAQKGVLEIIFSCAQDESELLECPVKTRKLETDISSKHRLIKLDISNNHYLSELVGIKEFDESDYSDVEELNMTNCGLRFDLLKKILAKCRSLRILNVSENDCRFHCESLDSSCASSCKCSLSGFFDTVKSTLRELSMRHCKLDSVWMTAIGEFENLFFSEIGSGLELFSWFSTRFWEIKK